MMMPGSPVPPAAGESEPLWAFPGGLEALGSATAFGFRQIIGCFMHWLVSRQRLGEVINPRRRAWLEALPGQESRTAEIVAQLDDQLLPGDLSASTVAFARIYLGLSSGRLNADYWSMMVEQQDRLDLSEVRLDASQVGAFGTCIDIRLQQFESGSPALFNPLDEPLVPIARQASPWAGSTLDAWLADLDDRTRTLAASRPSGHRAALLDWWAVVDAAPAFRCIAVVSALAQTWLHIEEVSVQQAVGRVLRQMPVELVVVGLLPILPQLGLHSSAASELLGVIQAPWTDDALEQIRTALRAAPAAQRTSFWRALQQAAEDDNADCGLLLEHLGGAA